MTASHLPNSITLPNGVVVKLEVTPMSRSDADGRYKLRCNYNVNMGLSCGKKLIELRLIGTAICGESEAELTDDSKLGEADIKTLDSEGWDQLLGLGVVPTELAL